MWDLSLLPHLCISSIICIYQHALMDIYFCTLGFNWMLLYFVIQSVSALAIGSFDIPPLVFFLFCFVFKALPYFLTSLILLTKCSRLILYISSPTLGISHFFKERWSFLLENIGIRNQDLDARYAHCYWGVVAFKSSSLTDWGNMWIWCI